MSVLTLADAKTHLNITVTTYDTELQGFIDNAEAAISARCGALTSTSRTSRVSGGGCLSLLLPAFPVLSLASITPSDGTAPALTDLYLNTSSGIVTRNDGTGFGARYYDVTYLVGRTSVPADLLLAVKEMVRHLWTDSQRGPAKRPGSAASDMASNTLPGAGYLLPFRVLELIAPYQLPGFA